MIFFYFCCWKCVLHMRCSATVTVITVISLVAHKLPWIHMNNQEKITRWLSKLKVHRANSQTISSYAVRFFTCILFFSLHSFAFFVFLFVFCLFVCLFAFFEIKKIYSDTHSTMWLGERYKNFYPVNFRKQDYFFWLDFVVVSHDVAVLAKIIRNRSINVSDFLSIDFSFPKKCY